MAEARSTADQRLDKRREAIALEARLEDGDRRIREAEAAGRDVQAWSDFWVLLLHQYEEIVAEIDPYRFEWPEGFGR